MSTPEQRLLGSTRYYNAGGLAAVWATQNTRQAIFDALRRREVYATSGTRIALRLFGSWHFPSDLCAQQDQISIAYESGVSMGGELRSSPATPPVFFIVVQRDPLSTPIEELQIVKGWLTPSGAFEQVETIASYAPSGTGLACTVWSDSSFDGTQPAFYYARVFEQPSPRWSTLDCQRLAVDCSEPPSVPEALQACCDGSLPETIRERAWSSPIWHRP